LFYGLLVGGGTYCATSAILSGSVAPGDAFSKGDEMTTGIAAGITVLGLLLAYLAFRNNGNIRDFLSSNTSDTEFTQKCQEAIKIMEDAVKDAKAAKQQVDSPALH